MFVQRVVAPSSRRESWTVVGTDGVPVEPIERYLAYLTDVERSPNTVKAYAHDLKDWFVFLALRGLDWREVRLEDVGEFVAWLRLPPAGRDGRVVVLPSVQGHCGDATVNRKLSAVSAFYQHHARERGRPGGSAPDVAASGARRLRVAAVPASHQQGQTPSAADDSDEGRRGSIRGSSPLTRFRPSSTAVIGCGIVCCSPFFMGRGCGLGRPSDCVMRIGSSRNGRSRSCPAPTTTVPDRSPPGRGLSRSAPSWSGCRPTICTASTGTWTATTCS